MSTFGFGVSNIQPSNSENIAPRRGKEEMQAKQQASKRSALGTITNTTRVQPFRAAKQGTNTDGFLTIGQENPIKGKSAFDIPSQTFQTQAFAIHTDMEEQYSELHQHSFNSENEHETKLTLHPAVTALRPALATIDNHIIDSPMVLDTSDNYPESIEDTAEERFEKILTVPEYADDIYKYLREAEQRNRPKPNYMKKQPDITMSMRSILIDWLVEVAEEYKLHRETLCLAVNYIDRFLSQMSVLRGKLQLVGAASMFLASKYEEIYPPEVGEFVYITDETYTKKQVLRMEHLILKVLSFDVAVPTVNCFCETFLKHLSADDQVQSLANYLIELTLVEGDPFLKYSPSIIAASAICLACHCLGFDAWSQGMVQYTGYELHDLEPCLRELCTMFQKAPSHPQQAVREKYKQDKYHQVSLMHTAPTLPVTTV